MRSGSRAHFSFVAVVLFAINTTATKLKCASESRERHYALTALYFLPSILFPWYNLLMLEVLNIHKNFEGRPLLLGVSLQVGQGETLGLLGPSGSGKSTLLRIIAGLEQPESGQVLWNGEDLAGVPVHKRNFGLMFQDYALFPHRNVYDNVAFGLRMKGTSRPEIEARVREALDSVGLLAFVKRRVTDLSGGEQQRVALARALVPRPRLLMLDEPLGALDRTLREQLTEDLHQLLHATGIPAIYVTHDQEEAFAIADRLVLLHDGQVEQKGSPPEVYSHPATPWAARFLGMANLLVGEVASANPFEVQTALGRLQAECPASDAPAPGSPVTLLLRPWAAELDGESPRANRLAGVVEDVIFTVEGYRAVIRFNPELTFQFIFDRQVRVGQAVTLSIEPEGIFCIERDS